jgi:hypothetical protein
LPRKASAIPVGTGFTPELIDLPAFLEVLIEHSGSPEALEDAVWQPHVRRPGDDPPTDRMRSLPVEAAIQYGLLTKDREATALARSLRDLQPTDLYRRFAQHILLRHGGLRVVEGIRQMQADDIRVTGDSLAQFLSVQGFPVSIHNTAINALRMWLSLAGVFPQGRANAWKISEETVEELVGLDPVSVAALTGLDTAQRGFLAGLCALNPDDWFPAAKIRNWAETTQGVQIGRQSLPKAILEPLRDAGLVEFRTGGTKGGKTSHVRTTGKFRSDVLIPFLETTLRDLESTVSEYYKKRPDDIYAGLSAKDRHVRGAALEAYTIHIMRLLGLQFVAWRKRSAQTAHAEVDILMTGLLGGLPTRWQLQCKNTTQRIRLEEIAKEVGLLPVTAASHIMFVATTSFTPDARKFADRIMARSATTIFLLDKADFEKIRETPTAIAQILQKQSEAILRTRSENPFSPS